MPGCKRMQERLIKSDMLDSAQNLRARDVIWDWTQHKAKVDPSPERGNKGSLCKVYEVADYDVFQTFSIAGIRENTFNQITNYFFY